MQNQENRPPVATSAKEAPFGSPRPLPVKNTFIHYGTPIRANTGIHGTPKTVPAHFAPEAELSELFLAPFPGSQPSAPIASPMPNTGGRPGPEAWRAGADREGQPNRGRGVAPLRLFDFLPSPTVQAPPPQVLQMMPQAPGQVPTTAFMPPPPPQHAVPNSGCVGIQAVSQPFWQAEPMAQAPCMAPAPTYAPMQYCAEGLQASSLQPPAWPPWNTSTTTVQLPGASAHCMGPVNNPVVASCTAPGMSMPVQGGNAVSMMAAPMFMAGSPAPQSLPPLPNSKP